MKNTDPLMGAKLKSKTHLQNPFFDFLRRFLRVWLQSLKKGLRWTLKKIFWKKIKKVLKNAVFHADFESVEKVVISYKQNKFDEHE